MDMIWDWLIESPLGTAREREREWETVSGKRAGKEK